MTDYLKLLLELEREFPHFRVVHKERSRFMVFLDLLLKVVSFGQMTEFMTRYVTVLGQTVYVPSSWGSMAWGGKVVALRHERVHLRQARRWGVLFAPMYLMWPVPVFLAYARMSFEYEAYVESMQAQFDLTRDVPGQYVDAVVRQLTGPGYLWAWAYKDGLRESLERERQRILLSIPD